MPDTADKSLESWIWDAACSIRGAKDAPKFKDYILPLIFTNWQRSEAELREVRKQVTFAIFAEEDNMEKVTATVEALFMLLQRSFRT
jgi:type I restriction-modification system DNA methylase subunit